MSQTSQDASGCVSCQRSALSWLLLRPSPVAKSGPLVPVGAGAVVANPALIKGLVPEAPLKHSRYALRLLRQGFVHLYVPNPPAGLKPWQVFRVTNTGNLIAESDPLYHLGPAPPACRRSGHNRAGMKLLPLPQAHLLQGPVWLAYSANRWNDEQRKRFAANPSAMVAVDVKAGGPHAFAPTAQALKSQVLECAVSRLSVGGSTEHDFEFSAFGNAGQTEDLAAQLEQAAACHPRTQGHALAVVLPDPVGIAAELNALRLRRQHLGLSATKEPEVEHRLVSHLALAGINQTVGDARALNNLAPLISHQSYQQLRQHSPHTVQSAQWLPLGEEDTPTTPTTLGRLWTPAARDKLADQAQRFGEIARTQVQKGYDVAASRAWFEQLNAKLHREHWAELEGWELDWLRVADGPEARRYFAQHFDEREPNTRLQAHSPGMTYAQESARIHGPQPMTTGPALQAFLDLYDRPITDPAAVALRAMVGNQGKLLEDVHQQVTGDPNGDAASGGMRDKTIDLIKGLLAEAGQGFTHKYSWLNNAVVGFAAANLAGLSAGTTTLLGAAAGSATDAKTQRMLMLSVQVAAWVKGMDHALQAALGKPLNLPVLLSRRVSLAQADRLLGRRSRPRQRGLARASTTVYLLTDLDTIRAKGGDLQALFEAQRPSLRAPHVAGATVLAASTGQLKAAYAQQGDWFEHLYREQSDKAKRLAGTIRGALPAGHHAAFMSADGRLALASVVVQSIGLLKGLQAVELAEADLKTTTPDKAAAAEAALSMAKLGLYDSIGGLTGGLIDTLRVGGEAMSLSRQAAGQGMALPKNIPINALRLGAQLVGVFGGVLNGYVAILKAKEQKQADNLGADFLYKAAALAFYGTAATSLLGTAGITAEFIVARQIGNATVQQVARAVATRVGTGAVAQAAAEAGAVTLGAAIGTAGVVLLGIGIVASVGAAVAQPTTLEAWARKTPFGNGPSDAKFPIGDIDLQQRKLYEALGLALAPAGQG